MDKVIVEVKFNEENPSEYNYKYFDAVLEDGKIETFHYHINNPRMNCMSFVKRCFIAS